MAKSINEIESLVAAFGGEVKIRKEVSPCGDETCCWEYQHQPASKEEALAVMAFFGGIFAVEVGPDQWDIYEEDHDTVPLILLG